MKRKSYNCPLWSGFKVRSFFTSTVVCSFLSKMTLHLLHHHQDDEEEQIRDCLSFKTWPNGSFYKVTLIYKWSTIFYYHWYSCAVHCRCLLYFSTWHEPNSLVLYNLLHVFLKKIPNLNVTLKWRENSTTVKNKT